MNFSTKIDIPLADFEIDHRSQLMMMGSCFVENIGEMLVNNKFKVNLNPFGILYNPQSIVQSLHRLIENKVFEEDELFEYGGLYHSFYHHSRFSQIDQLACLDAINTSLKKAADDLPKTDILFITFGTAYVYKHIQQDSIVGNCHKLPASHFERYRLDVNTIVDSWLALVNELQRINPTIRIIFTVSPIRHLKDGAHNNQLSKSTLLLAVDRLCKANKSISYFPSYEIVLDELRDYRFYKEDMVHPTDVAIKYIWQRLAATYFLKDTLELINQWNKIKLATKHRSFNQQSNEYQSFLRQTLLKLELFATKHPYICFDDEIVELTDRLLP